MEYIYGEFTDNQIKINAKLMHNEIHKLLLYKDNSVIEQIFSNDTEYEKYFKNLLVRYGGLNTLLGEPPDMVSFMSTLQAAYDEVNSDKFSYRNFRRLILDAHGLIEKMFEEVDEDA